MEPEYVSMREMLDKALLRDKRPTDPSDSRPVWRVGGSSATGSERVISLTGEPEGTAKWILQIVFFCTEPAIQVSL